MMGRQHNHRTRTFMKTKLFFLITCISLMLATLATAAAPPLVRRHSIPMPVDAQSGAKLGYSSAMDGNRVALGAPDDDTGAEDGGMVKIFNTTTGALELIVPNPGPSFNEQFGSAVALSGNRLVVGAPNDSTGASGAGSVYVYDLAGATPATPVLTLNNPAPANYDAFGFSVALSGNQLVVGARMDDADATDAGRAYVYDLGSGTPTVPVHTLANPSADASDQFGYSVAIDGSIVIVGAWFDDIGATNTGRAYVYDLSSGSPTVPVHSLDNPTPADGDVFGYRVALSGAKLVVGAYNDSTVAPSAGSVYLYNLESATPTTPVTISNPTTPATNENFGTALSLVGTRLIVGAYGENTGASVAGAAFVYDVSASPTLVRTFNNNLPAVQDRFGFAVCQLGNLVLISTPYDDADALDSGTSYLYDLAGFTPGLPTRSFSHTGNAAGNEFGGTAAISGSLVAVGARLDDLNFQDSASVQVFDLNNATPSVPVLTIANPTTLQCQFAGGLALEGNRLVVGAPQFYANFAVLGEGRVFIYDLAGATPGTPVLTLSNPGPNSNDKFGTSVAVSGNLVAVGTPGDDTGASDAGSVYIFDLSSGTPTVPVLTLNHTAANSDFGFSVAISGTRLIVGAYNDDTGAANTGRAFVYDLASGTPTVPVATLNNPTPSGGENFGWSVAIDGTQAVVGAHAALNAAQSLNVGAAYVYNLASATPTTPTYTLYAPNPADNDFFGRSVTIGGGHIVVGANLVNDGATDTGKTFLYDLASATPTTPLASLSQTSPAAIDQFGTAVGISGQRILATAPYSDLSGRDQGAIFVFEPPSNNANLSGLALSAGTLSPAFASSTTTYNADLPFGTTSITVTPTSADAHASITVNGNAVTSGNASGSITVSVGSTPITIALTAEDETTTKTYTVNANVPGSGTIAFSSPVYSVLSGASGTMADILINRSGSTAGTVSCTLSSTDGTATAPAHYTAQSSTAVSLTNGVNQTHVMIPVAAGAATTTARAFTITLDNISNGATLGSPSSATVVILPPGAATDLVKPVTTITAPAISATIVDTVPVVISGTVTDNVAVARVQVSFNNSPYTDAAVSLPGSTATTYTLNVTPAPGLNSFNVRALDCKGNVSATVTRTFTHLRTLTVSVSGPANSGSVTTGFVPTSNRQAGKSYTIVATPKPGFVFDGWTVNNTTNTGITPLKMELPSLSFIMQPGLTLTAKFIVNPFTSAIIGDYSGLFTPSATQPLGGTFASNATVGLCTAKLTATGALTGSVKIDGLSLPIIAICDNTGVARFGPTRATTFTHLRPGKPSLILSVTADLSGATRQLTGTLREFFRGDKTAESTLIASRHHFNGTTSIVPATYVKSYTARLKARTSQGVGFTTHDYPQGDGYLTFKVLANGSVTMSGKLADDTIVTMSSNLSQSLHWPIFQSLYLNKGCIAADALLDDTQADTDATAMNMLWFRPFQNVQWYPYGWDEGVFIDMLASKYTPSPATVFPGLAATNPTTGNTALSFTDGLLTSSVTKFLNLTTTNVLSKAPTTDTSFTFVPAFNTGVLNGTFTHTDGSKPKWQGVLMQKGANKGGHGYFMSSKPAVLNYLGESGAMHWLAK